MLKISNYSAVIKGVRQFPDLTFTITENKTTNSAYKYHAESDYAYWTPFNPIEPYRHNGSGKTIETAVKSAMNTFEIYPTDELSDDMVFITKGHSSYENEEFIDGTGKTCTYDEAHAIINANNMIK